MALSAERVWIGIAALSGACATLADVASRHLLAAFVQRSDYALIGARLGYVHALALLAVATFSLLAAPQCRWLQVSGWSFAFGQILFSGSLYLISADLAYWSGRATVPGIILLLIGWLCLFAHAISRNVTR